MEVIPESSLEKEVAAMGPVVNKRRRKRRNEGAGANAPPKVLRKDYAASRPAQGTRGEKSIVIIGLNAGSTFSRPATAPQGIYQPSKSSKEMATEVPTRHVATTKVQGGISAKSPESVKSTPFLSVDGSPKGIYQPGWGVTNNYRLDTPDTCQDMVDHVVPPRIKAREEEIEKLDHEIKSLRTVEMELHSLRNQTKNLETLLEAEQVSTLRAQVTGEERIKAAFKEFTKYEDDRVNSRCAEIDARFDALSIDFDKELYPHMLMTIAGRRWVIGAWSTSSCYESSKLRQVFVDVVSTGVAKGMSEGLKHGIEHGKANLDLAAIEAYDPEADAKYVTALQALKDLKCPLVGQLEKLKDAPIDLIMASLCLENDSRENAPYVQDTPITVAEATKVSVPRKRRGVIIQDPEETTTTVTVQPKLDEEVARQLEAELNDDINWNTVFEKVKRSERLTDVVMKYQALKRKPLTEAQARRNMIVSQSPRERSKLKKEVEVESSKREGESLEQEITKKQKMEQETEELKKHLQIVPDDDDDDVHTDATPLASKVPIIDYKIHTKRNRPYFKIIKADRNHRLFLSFSTMLKNFDREDLESLWNIIRERFAKTQPNNYSDDFLLNTLKIMFEKPNVEANKMINDVRLEVEDESEMFLELLRLVRRQLNEGGGLLGIIGLHKLVLLHQLSAAA
nr:hypothetical protein [Tanacetum cinerariifolium]